MNILGEARGEPVLEAMWGCAHWHGYGQAQGIPGMSQTRDTSSRQVGDALFSMTMTGIVTESRKNGEKPDGRS